MLLLYMINFISTLKFFFNLISDYKSQVTIEKNIKKLDDQELVKEVIEWFKIEDISFNFLKIKVF